VSGFTKGKIAELREEVERLFEIVIDGFTDELELDESGLLVSPYAFYENVAEAFLEVAALHPDTASITLVRLLQYMETLPTCRENTPEGRRAFKRDIRKYMTA